MPTHQSTNAQGIKREEVVVRRPDGSRHTPFGSMDFHTASVLAVAKYGPQAHVAQRDQMWPS
jgi:hypothetical protein